MRVIAGSAKGTPLTPPQGTDIRPTTDRVKEATFSALHFSLNGALVLDLFAGCGQMGIEALSRGAAHCTFVDAQRTSCELIRQNLKKTRLNTQATVRQTDSKNYLFTSRDSYDIILLDPPYAATKLDEFLASCAALLCPGGTLVVETDLKTSLPESLPGARLLKTHKYGRVKITRYKAPLGDVPSQL